jgi:hypothetical protein
MGKHCTGYVKLKRRILFHDKCKLFILDVDYRLCITWIIYQQIWGYKVEEKLHLVVCEQKRLITPDLDKQVGWMNRETAGWTSAY